MNPKNKSSPFNISFIPKEAFQPDNPRKLHGWLGNHWVARVVLCVLYQVLYVHIEQQPLGGVEILAM